MPRTILIVDDNEINLQILRNILQADYQVVECRNGRDAMAVLAEEGRQITAVLLDLLMPVMDGYAVLEQMRAIPALSQIPVIVTTGSAGQEAEKRALSLGANDFVVKPFDAEILRHRLQNLVGLREASLMVNTLQKDRLTGLWTREAFFEKAAALIAEKPEGYYVLESVDIDGFKIVNDQYGIETGDRVLRALAQRLQKGCGTEDGLCGRIAADGFVALHPASLVGVSEDERRQHEPFSLDYISMPIVLSSGRYAVCGKAMDVRAMYDRASIAQATVKGRYDVHLAMYDETMRSQLLEEQEIVSEMRTALLERQFETWFQPQYNHATGALIGAEALVRWRHPRKGLMDPVGFIPTFERNGFIYELDKYVWESVCASLKRWKAAGRSPLPVSVNVSRYDLYCGDLFSVLDGLVRSYGISASLLRLEITESAFSESIDHVVSVVKQLVARGFTVEIDDFGSGYSSLNTLKDVPAQILKLDMRFLDAATDTDRGGNILESVIRMSKWLGMSVIAEGVETFEQADFLKSIGCRYMQGFVYARPMPEDEYEKLSQRANREEKVIAMKAVEHLDNNAFWDPRSMDTLIFNSYVGAACILEFFKGRIEMLRATEYFIHMLGSSCMCVEDALELDWTAHMDTRNICNFSDAVMESLETHEVVSCEYEFLDLPGCPRRTFIRAGLRVIATTGDRCLIYCLNDNITAQKEAEQKEGEISAQLRFLNDIAHDLLAQPDIETGIEDVLRKMLHYFDAARAYVFELDGQGQTAHNTYEVCAQGVPPQIDNLRDVPYSAYGFWWEIFRGGGYVSIDDVSALPDSRAEERTVLAERGISSLIAVSLHRDGQLVGFVGVDDPACEQKHIAQLQALGDYLTVMLTRRDYTVRMRQDEKKKAALSAALVAAKQASVAKSSFLSRMSHELRTPMNAIIGLSALSAAELDDPASIKDNVEKIDSSARYLLSLINDILEMSRIESGHMTLLHESFSFARLIGNINVMIGAQAAEKGLRYTSSVGEGVSDSYMGDATKLQEILINVLGNAVKYTPPGGSVGLVIEPVADSGALRFVISDTGIGIDEGFLPHLFDSFTQESASYTSTSTGSGLGLAITKNLVEMMGGSIEVQSAKGKGSTFTITLCLDAGDGEAGVRGRAADGPAISADEADFSGCRFLLVEDNALNIEVARRMLEMKGARVVVAQNGQEAVDLVEDAEGETFDAILMDIHMPVMDGITATKAIRALQDPRRRGLPIIAMTADAFDEDVKLSLSSGMNDHLTKPIDPAALFGTLARFTHKEVQ